jgi:hypothetical protein
MPRLHITPEQLRQAWALRRRPDWPASFDAAMARPLLASLVRAYAIGLLLARAKTPPPAQAPPPGATTPASTPPARRPTFDRKRAAAGDIDHDDD